MLEPLGIRFFGVEFREAHLESILRALKEAIEESEYFREDIDQVDRLCEQMLKFGDLVVESKSFLDSNPETLSKFFLESGLNEYAPFFETLLQNMVRRKSLINMFSTLSSVVVEEGSTSLKFRNRTRKIEKLRINMKKLWKEVHIRSKQIKNSFKHTFEIAIGEVQQSILCIGVYGAAFVLAVFSLWYGVAFSVVSGLSTIAQNILRGLKICFPIVSFVIWIFCLLYSVGGGFSKAKDAYEAMKRFLG